MSELQVFPDFKYLINALNRDIVEKIPFLPSRSDTFGVVMLESMASGTPVAAYPVTGPRDVITSENGAMDEDLAHAVGIALGRDRRKVRKSSKAYDWETCTKTFLDALTVIPKD
jgi:glycosyltransferase involved in cell wall biosynthesis